MSILSGYIVKPKKYVDGLHLTVVGFWTLNLRNLEMFDD